VGDVVWALAEMMHSDKVVGGGVEHRDGYQHHHGGSGQAGV